jgi:electron transfer flavoprotein alpha subunit
VLVVGQGEPHIDADGIAALARRLGAEAGYSRARVMNGGYDVERLIGISGHLLAPDVCIVAGASGAAALMTGVRDSRFIVAINRDASAPVFARRMSALSMTGRQYLKRWSPVQRHNFGWRPACGGDL